MLIDEEVSALRIRRTALASLPKSGKILFSTKRLADETPEQPDAFLFSKKNLSNAKKLESGTPLEREKNLGVGEAYEPGLADKQDFAHQDKSEGQPAQ